MLNRLLIIGLALSLFALAGCKKDGDGAADGDRCGKFVDKSVANAAEMAKAMSAKMPPDQAKAMLDKITAQATEKRPQMLEKCNSALKSDASLGAVMDCVNGAADLAAAAKCDPDNKLAAVR